MQDRINNIEEMTNKVVEYIHATSENNSDHEFQCMAVAAKFLLASFYYEPGVYLSDDDILEKCEDLANLIISLCKKIS